MSKKNRLFVKRFLAVTSVCSALATMAGCGAGTPSQSAPATYTTALRGGVHGGQQPIAGATILLYAAGTTAYESPNTNLLNKTVLTDMSGGFTILDDYKCTAGQQMYIVAIGGNPGAGINPNGSTMAALGDCAQLGASTYINMNEVTTVGSAFALAPFMSSYTALGSSPTNIGGLARAFASVNKLVNFTNGTAGGSALPAGATAPVSEIYTLANILAACINSTGGVAGDSSPCGALFQLTTPPGGVAPTDVVQAALDMAKNPTLNVGLLYLTVPPVPAFGSALTAAPNDWTLSINYAAGSFHSPRSTTVDASGNVWVANAGNNTVTVLNQAGVPLPASPFSGNGLSAPVSIAIDASGNAWTANSGGSTVSAFTPSGSAAQGSPFAAGAGPVALAFDAPGNLWVANSTDKSVSELTSAGATLQTLSSGSSTPAAIAIDPR